MRILAGSASPRQTLEDPTCFLRHEAEIIVTVSKSSQHPIAPASSFSPENQTDKPELVA